VRPIDQTDSSSGQARSFDAVRYVDSIWDTKVLPTVAASAVDLREALQARRAACLLVKGEGRVLRVDTSSRSGLMLVDLAPYDGRADAAIQIGPVIRGTVLRDALPFIQFSQFVNQLEFARVGNALNDRVVQSVLVSLPKTVTAGSSVSFSGASSQPAANELPEIVPVTLVVKEKA
jgi:predicted lipoprotein